MSALRAMLQLRSSSASDAVDTATAPAPSSTATTLAPALLAAVPSSSASSSASSFTTATTTTTSTSSSSNTTNTSASLPNTSSSSLLTTSPQRHAPPAKKPAPFQNLGLHSGAASGNLGLVKFALDNGQPIDSVLNGVYAIHAACCSNANVAVVLYLIERGADVNARRLPRKYSSEKGVQTVGTTGSTPLHFAAANGCLAVVDILLRHGAIVDMTDKYGSSPLSVAAARNHPDVASLLRQYSAMQRGVMDLTPDNESKDPFIDRRGSSDLGHRSGSAVITPPARSASGHTKDTSSQSLPHLSGRASQTTRTPGQRRISLPSITESPSSPNIPPPPRQSCDFARTPQSTEPLVLSTASIRSTPSQPTRNTTTQSSRLEDRPSMRSPTTREHSDTTATASTSASAILESTGTGGEQSTTHSMRRSHTIQAAQSDYLTTPESTSTMRRRKSMESAALLSPQSAMSVHRRKSFEQLSSNVRRTDSKSRRSSVASTASEGTASSATSGTSHTSVSDHGADPAQESGQSQRQAQQSQGQGKSSTQTEGIDSGNAPTAPSLLTRSMSQPMLEQVKPRRPPVSFALEATARQSLDLQRLASNLDRAVDKDRHYEPRNDSDSDLPSLLFRRRTMQDTVPPKISGMMTMPRYHSMGPTMESLASSSSISDENSSQFQRQAQQQQQQYDQDGSSSMLQDGSMASQPRLSSSSGHSESVLASGGTATGRFSRMWSSASHSGSRESLKEGAVAGNWNVGEFGEASGEAAVQALARPRGSVLNRISGIWSRR